MNNVILVRGISGSGKSTYLKTNYPHAFVCSADDFLIDENGVYVWSADKLRHAHQYSINAFKAALINKLPVIAVDNTNTTLGEIKPYINLAKQYNYGILIVRIVAPVEVAVARNVHNVPEETVKKQQSRLVDLPEEWGINEIFYKGE